MKKRPGIVACVLASLGLIWGCRVSPTQPLIEGERLIKEGRYAEAVKKLEAATQLMPTNAQALNHLGLAYHGAGQLDQAEHAYRQALALERKLAAAHYNLGCLYLEEDKLQDALDELTSYVFLDPRSLEGRLKLARAQRRLGNLNEAERTLQDVLKVQADLPEALNAMGLIQVARRRPLDANYYFRRVLDQNGQHPQSLLNLAILTQQHLNNTELARKYYQQYLQLTPLPPKAGEVRRLLDELEQPKPRASLTQPSTSNATPSASSSRTTGVVSRAEVSSTGAPPLRATAPVRPRSWPRYTFRAPARPASGNRSVADAYFRGGVTAQAEGRFKDAVIAYRRAIQADPAYYEAYYNLGLAAYRLETWPEALDAYELALTLQPQALDARYNFALALKKAGYPADAADQLRRLLRDHPREARAHLSLATLCAQQLDDLKSARQSYQKFLDLAPDHAEAGRVREWLSSHPQ